MSVEPAPASPSRQTMSRGQADHRLRSGRPPYLLNVDYRVAPAGFRQSSVDANEARPSARPRILVLTGYYLPGNAGGGPVRSVSNMIECLGDDFEFRVVTPDRDFRSSEPYPGVKPHHWTPVGKGLVYYVAPESVRRGGVLSAIRETPHDVLYLNSFFHAHYTLAPLVARRIGRLKATRVLIAPRGELGVGALRLKAWKKSPFLTFSRSIGLYGDLAWHATSDAERADVRRVVDSNARVFIAPNLATPIFLEARAVPRPVKAVGSVRLVFASRLMRKKNLAHLLRALQHVRGSVTLTVYGPIEDNLYWEECQALVRALPPHVVFEYGGFIAADDMPKRLDQHHVFVLPTLNENYGHAIVEALARGLPAIISNCTPWGDLESSGAGAIVGLADPKQLSEAIQAFISMSAEQLASFNDRAAKYGRARIEDTAALAKTRDMLDRCAHADAEVLD